ncbi:CLUMA_CG010433, isoform A [Clunio marinus]|uniref:CLUMA_CG010433, isoform A n=1 Tax=Clunio marinus TaxID=568069 RepID=A0A1J1ID47_9DIPT|nr:CLUMA_CG010433, isoform A [Clunio marinus]
MLSLHKTCLKVQRFGILRIFNIYLNPKLKALQIYFIRDGNKIAQTFNHRIHKKIRLRRLRTSSFVRKEMKIEEISFLWKTRKSSSEFLRENRWTSHFFYCAMKKGLWVKIILALMRHNPS